jgi:hypothetical protein
MCPLEMAERSSKSLRPNQNGAREMPRVRLMLAPMGASSYSDIKRSLRQLYLDNPRPWLVGFSGGKDSTVLSSRITGSSCPAIPSTGLSQRIWRGSASRSLVRPRDFSQRHPHQDPLRLGWRTTRSYFSRPQGTGARVRVSGMQGADTCSKCQAAGLAQQAPRCCRQTLHAEAHELEGLGGLLEL